LALFLLAIIDPLESKVLFYPLCATSSCHLLALPVSCHDGACSPLTQFSSTFADSYTAPQGHVGFLQLSYGTPLPMKFFPFLELCIIPTPSFSRRFLSSFHFPPSWISAGQNTYTTTPLHPPPFWFRFSSDPAKPPKKGLDRSSLPWYSHLGFLPLLKPQVSTLFSIPYWHISSFPPPLSFHNRPRPRSFDVLR